jgi:lysophospholipase L1-like esterase
MRPHPHFSLLNKLYDTKHPGALALALLLTSLVACQDKQQEEANTPATSASTATLEPSVRRIMPLGDSVTQGDASHNSYRRPLWKTLEVVGFAVDFVGSQRSNHKGSPPQADFDTDHEGHWGWRTDQILEHIQEWTKTHEPDVLLVHLGSNDVFQQQTIESTVEDIKALIEAVRSSQPMSVILIAQIIPTTDQELNRHIEELNARLPALAEAMSTEDSAVRVVDHFTRFDASIYTYDGVHPNAKGEVLMADRWAAALKKVLPTTKEQ